MAGSAMLVPRFLTVSRMAIAVLFLNCIVPQASMADGNDQKLPAGDQIDVTAGGVDETFEVKGIDSSVDVELDFLSIWPSLHETLPDWISPSEPGQDITSDSLERPNAPVIFAYGEQQCAQEVLNILRIGISSEAIEQGAKSAVTTSLSVASFVLSGFSVPGAAAVDFISDAVEVVLESDSAEEFAENLAKYVFSEAVKKGIEEVGDLDGFLKELIDKSVDGLFEELSEFVEPESTQYQTTFTLPNCGDIDIIYQMFAQHPKIPRNTLPASVVMAASGNCRGNDGRFARLYEFLIAAEYEVRPTTRRRGPRHNVIVLRADSPQIYVEANCKAYAEFSIDPATTEWNGFDRPSWVDDEIVKAPDWTGFDRACYDMIQKEYDDWWVARRNYNQAVLVIEQLDSERSRWGRGLEEELQNGASESLQADYRAKIEDLTERFEREFEALPNWDGQRRRATQTLIPVVQECVDQLTQSKRGEKTVFGEKLLRYLNTIPLPQ
ncbi:hypothetical protein ACFFUT_14530 [Pseudohalocynthiibacter aestuariivivens]|jgi:hypothetical protein|uniref:Secreted protein n=1 Tax=Pseudohalocynthiibacter aestuariivivens TaxID=1591409 RepID=A0ABV5JHY4_9RHOB|nr:MULTISPECIES: hypothetical protein [Pseudohalocynthiibacter]MBS9718941.1 hypothetical protein [Pseudohalocynthiibacter aestuariivivens]MCK0104378.1 hypothetical protein [Pseudohalocynthiibacter sp. F2068]